MSDGKPEYPTDLKPRDLEPHYSRHVGAMTAEALHSKADIAIQLAWRDQTIARLLPVVAAARQWQMTGPPWSRRETTVDKDLCDAVTRAFAVTDQLVDFDWALALGKKTEP